MNRIFFWFFFVVKVHFKYKFFEDLKEEAKKMIFITVGVHPNAGHSKEAGKVKMPKEEEMDFINISFPLGGDGKLTNFHENPFKLAVSCYI